MWYSYEVDGETIRWFLPMNTYLGCVVDEYLVLKEMVEDKEEAGRRALGARLQRCQAEK